jgi:O-antigen/teichoic acid export membrane protein
MVTLTSERSAAAGGLILILRFAAASVLNYVFGGVLAWLLVPAAFGTVSALQNVLLLAAGALSAGLPWALAVKIASSQGDLDSDAKEFRIALLGNVVFGLVIAAVFLISQLAGLRVIPAAGFAMTVTVACTVPMIGVNTVLGGALAGSRRFGGLGAMQSGEILVKCVVGLALVVVAHSGAEGVAVGFLVGSVASTAIAVVSLRGLLPGPGPLARLRTFRMAVPIWAGTASFFLLLTADVLGLALLGKGHGVTAGVVAAYQVCAILGRAPYYVSDALIDAVFPFMARCRKSRVASHAWFLAAVRWVPLFVVPIQLGLVFAPGVLLRLFFPHSYGGFGSLLQLITIGTLGLLLTNMLVKGLYALRCATRVGRRLPWAVWIELAALVTLVPGYGATGAAIAYCLGGWAGVLLLGSVYLREQRVGLPPWTLSGRYLIALSPSAAVIAASNLVPDPVAGVLILLALGVFAGMARLMRLFNDDDVRRLRGALTAARWRSWTGRRSDRNETALSGQEPPVPSTGSDAVAETASATERGV